MRDLLPGFKDPMRRVIAPTMTYTKFTPWRNVAEWTSGGETDEGCEPNGTVLRYEVIEALNRSLIDRQPCEYVVIGERRYSDGRHFLDFAINPEWMRATTNYQYRNERWVWVCPECDGQNDDHRKIEIDKQRVPCPRDTRPTRSRG